MSETHLSIPFVLPSLNMYTFSEWDTVSIRGTDRMSFLSGLVSNEVKKLALGSGNLSFFLTAKGRIVHELLVASVEDALVLLTPPRQGQAVYEALDYYHFTEDIEMKASSNEWSTTLMYGTQLESWFSQTFGQELPENNQGCNLQEALGTAQPAWAIRLPLLGDVPSVLLWLDAASTEHVQNLLQDKGIEQIDDTTWAQRRNVLGWYSSQHILKDRLVHEVGREHTHVSYTKGCFVGQEVVARTEHRGRATQGLFVVRRIDGESSSMGEEIIDEKGKTVGTVLQEIPIDTEQKGLCCLLKLKAVEEKSELFVYASETDKVPLQRVEFVASN